MEVSSVPTLYIDSQSNAGSPLFSSGILGSARHVVTVNGKVTAIRLHINVRLVRSHGSQVTSASTMIMSVKNNNNFDDCGWLERTVRIVVVGMGWTRCVLNPTTS